MELNKKKSGIVVFSNRRKHDVPYMHLHKDPKTNKKEWRSVLNNFEGIPIVQQYKYLGTILHCKLSCSPQLAHIKKKTAHLLVKLYPYLVNATAEGRRDMWQTMTAPLFNATLALLNVEPSQANKENVYRLWRMTFKQFMMISHKTPTTLTTEMMNKDLNEICATNTEINKDK